MLRVLFLAVAVTAGWYGCRSLIRGRILLGIRGGRENLGGKAPRPASILVRDTMLRFCGRGVLGSRSSCVYLRRF